MSNAQVAEFKEERLIKLLEDTRVCLFNTYKEALLIGQPKTILVALENIAMYIITLIDGFKEKVGV